MDRSELRAAAERVAYGTCIEGHGRGHACAHCYNVTEALVTFAQEWMGKQREACAQAAFWSETPGNEIAAEAIRATPLCGGNDE